MLHYAGICTKLGPEHERLIGTVRNVGYKFVRPTRTEPSPPTTPDTERDPDTGVTTADGTQHV